VTIVIPSRDKVELLSNCIESIRQNTLYGNYEILVVDNDSVEPKTAEYFRKLMGIGAQVLHFPGAFNFAAICNAAAEKATGEILCFLNNDAEIYQTDWLDWLVGKALEPLSGVVGPILMETTEVISDGGIALGQNGVAGMMLKKSSILDAKLKKVLSADHPVSAISFACAVVSREKFLRLGGMDASFAVGLNDVDFGIRAGSVGLRNYLVTNSLVLHSGYGSRKKMSSFRGALKAFVEVLHFFKKYPEFNFRDELTLRS
jgi:GT2 family glycosyltransferase